MTIDEEYDYEVRSWLGTPFRHQCSIRGYGTDCIGLVMGVFKNLCIIPDDLQVGEYTTEWWQTRCRNEAMEELKRQVPVMEVTDYEPGDILVYGWGRADEAHVGLYTQKGTVIHSIAINRTGVVESQMRENRYLKNLTCAYRIVDWKGDE